MFSSSSVSNRQMSFFQRKDKKPAQVG